MCLVGPRNSLVAFDVSIYHLPFPHLPLYSSGIDGCENWTSFLCYIETILLLPLFLITIHPHFHSHPSSGGTIQISGNMSILGVLLHRMLDGSGIRCTMHRSCTSRVREIIKLPWESFSYVLYDIPTIGSSCRAVPVPLMLHRKWICIILPCNMWAFRTD